jgi:hypothetical protein
MAAAMGVEMLTEEQYLGIAKAWRVRYEVIELGEDTPGCEKT